MTIKDLARISGYSLGTVSRALNHQPNVSPKARDRILSLAMQYGYEINTNAQNLKQQSSNIFLVIVKGTANELFARMVEEVQHLAGQDDRHLVVDYIDEDDNEVRRAIQLCRERKPRGILFYGGTRKNFEADFDKVNVPSVLVTNTLKGLDMAGLSSVTTDDAAAACTATQLLIRSGHRHIAVIGGDPEISEISANRLDGCRRAFADSGAELTQYENTRFSFEGGYHAMENILRDNGKVVTAIFAMSDVMAIGAMRCLHDAHLRIPEDVSVVGFDGVPFGQFYAPRLATISQSTAELARTSYRILVDSISGGNARHCTVAYSLSMGESVGRQS